VLQATPLRFRGAVAFVIGQASGVVTDNWQPAARDLYLNVYIAHREILAYIPARSGNKPDT
jgi:hypothetical protein